MNGNRRGPAHRARTETALIVIVAAIAAWAALAVGVGAFVGWLLLGVVV